MIPSEHPIQPKLATLETSITDCTNSTVIANDIESEIFSYQRPDGPSQSRLRQEETGILRYVFLR